MTFRPAHEERTLVHGDFTVTLRPSLRAATILEHEYGFEKLFARIEEFHLGTIADIIMTTTTDQKDATAFLKSFHGQPLVAVSAAVKAPIAAVCRAFVPSTDKETKGAGKPMTWPDYYAELYRLATGWLGWTPRTTWRASPSEINEAFAGHVAMLKAIHGSGEEKNEKADVSYTAERLKEIDELGYDPAFDRAGLASIRAKIEGRKA